MTEDVKACVDARVNFIGEYLTVPDELKDEVNSFIADITALGNSSGNAADFESKFVSSGLMDRFNSLIPRCPQKPREMTKEEKAQSKEIAKEMGFNAKDIAKQAGEDALESLSLEAERMARRHRREEMVEAGVYDDYTRASNVVDDTKRLFGFFKRKNKD